MKFCSTQPSVLELAVPCFGHVVGLGEPDECGGKDAADTAKRYACSRVVSYVERGT